MLAHKFLNNNVSELK